MDGTGDAWFDEPLVCGDCGADLDAGDATPVPLADIVLQVCPTCQAVRQELDALLG